MKKYLLIILVCFSLFICSFLFQSIGLAIGEELDYPTRPINFFIGTGPGGSTDLAYRAIITAANKYLKQPIIPINKPGAGTVVAAMAVKTAKPDGYTLGSATTSSAFVAPFVEDAQFRDLSGFTMIMNFAKICMSVIVKADAPWQTWKQFIEWARQNPGAAKIGITGAKRVAMMGLVLARVEKEEKVKFTYVSFDSLPEILTATLGGHISVYGSALSHPTVVEYVREGKLRLLANSDISIPGFENYPSLQELYRWETSPNIHAIWGPKGLSNPVINKLGELFAKATKDQDFIESMKKLYMPVAYMNKTELDKYAERTLKDLKEVMKEM